MEEIATIMRTLWLKRNEFIFEGKFKCPSQVVTISRDDLKDYQLAQQTIRRSIAAMKVRGI